MFPIHGETPEEHERNLREWMDESEQELLSQGEITESDLGGQRHPARLSDDELGEDDLLEEYGMHLEAEDGIDLDDEVSDEDELRARKPRG
jgi:hypothetical protein